MAIPYVHFYDWHVPECAKTDMIVPHDAAGDTSIWARTIGKRMSGSGNYVGLVNNVAELMKLDENQVKGSLVPVSE
jgi:hypothetical protein